MMDIAAFSPKKFQLLNHASPRGSARKRMLFPTSSPQSDDNDLGLIGELSSDSDTVYSPAMASPTLSVSPLGTPRKNATSHLLRLDQKMKVVNHLQFSNSPRKSYMNKENSGVTKSVKKSPRKPLMSKENFDDNFITLLPDSPEKNEKQVEFELSFDNFITPKKTISQTPEKRSPRSAKKNELILKPNSFYGNVAPLLAANQTNRIQGMKCVFRPAQPSRAKAKLLFEDKPKAKKRERSRSVDLMREAKRRKAVFTGVCHAIPRPVKYSPPEKKQESIRDKALKVTDFSRTPYIRDRKNKQNAWEYTLRFTKPMRVDDTQKLDAKRKFFKTSIEDSPSLLSTCSSNDTTPPLVVNKKRKLLDPRKDYLEQKSPEKPKLNVADISDMINDLDADKLQEKPEVDDILLRLEEDDKEDKSKEAERQMLMNLLEDVSEELCPVDSLSNYTASLVLNDSFSGCSRVSLEDIGTPKSVLSISQSGSAGKALSDVTNSSGKKKWRGVGKRQLQIDAGQKRFGAQQCGECGMVYQAGEAEDEMQHKAFHSNLSTLKHVGWKGEKIVGKFGMDYVIMITNNDPKNWQQKALDVMAVVDKSLGISSTEPQVMHHQKVFLYIADRQVVGCIVAGPVRHAYRLLDSESDMDLCSEESFPVKCGVSRIWTLFAHRRCGIASRLVDTVRCNFMYGCILRKEDVAFSVPTPAGKQFASKYMGTPHLLVYTGY